MTAPSVSYFRYGYRNGREINFTIWPLSLRLARHQVGLWFSYRPIFNILF